MSERERLPDRREAELVDFEHEGRKWTVTVGRFADGRIAEVFIDGPTEVANRRIGARRRARRLPRASERLSARNPEACAQWT